SAEASLDAVSSQCATPSGRGIMKTRNANGKAAAAIHFRPKKRNPAAVTREIDASAVRDCESLAFRVMWNAPFTPKNAPRPDIAKKAAQPNDDSYFFGSSSRRTKRRYADRKGISKI